LISPPLHDALPIFRQATRAELPLCVARVRDARSSASRRSGFTLFELLIVLVLVGIVLAIAAPRLRGFDNELANAASETAGFFRQTRSTALASTSAYRVIVVSPTRLRTELSGSCAAPTGRPDDQRRLELRDGIVMQGTPIVAGSTLVCFDSRGMASASPAFELRDREGKRYSIQLFLGGAVQMAPVP